MTDPAPRVRPITPEERTEDVLAMMTAMAGVGASRVEDSPVLATFARHPRLTHPFLVFNRHLLSYSTLPDRLRQIAILRVAWLKHSRFLWSSHLLHSLLFGLDEADFEAAKLGAAAEHWSALERAVVTATEQLVVDSDLSDAAWQAITAELSEQQVLDLIFTVGAYSLLATTFNAIRIQRLPRHLELAEQYGSPE